MKFTDLYINKPVLAIVVSLVIFVLGVRSLGLMPIREFPFTQNAVVTVSTSYSGADAEVIASFLTTPLERAIAQANGIDFLTSTSTENSSTITANLRLNYDPQRALTEISAKVNSVLNQLPRDAQLPSLNLSVGGTLDAVYIAFYSDVLPNNKITDYLVRTVQPKMQAIPNVQLAQIIGGRNIALRAWLDPVKMSALGLTSSDVSAALLANNVTAVVGRTDGQGVTINMTSDTGLTNAKEFEDLVVKSDNDTLVKLKDIAKISVGAESYDTKVKFDGHEAIYIGVQVAPDANLLTVVKSVKNILPEIQAALPQGMKAEIAYDSTKYVDSSINEVIWSLIEAVIIVILVIFLFLGSLRTVIIPVVAIPLSIIGTFFVMYVLGYSINVLTLLALVLSIGLVVDDAIIVVENAYRHMESGMKAKDAALLGARELANPIIAITAVLIAVYLPIGFMGGLTGALFTEFAFTVAGAVTISAIIALTLSPMMCSKYLKVAGESQYAIILNYQFGRLEKKYLGALHNSLNNLIVAAVFSIIVIISLVLIYKGSKSELAPQEDQGVVLSLLRASPNSTLEQTEIFDKQVYDIYYEIPEKDHIFQIEGRGGLNVGFNGLRLKPWDERTVTSHQILVELQKKFGQIAGATIGAFQRPSLPGSGSGFPFQMVIQTTESYIPLDAVSTDIREKALASGLFLFLETDLKIDKAQTRIDIDREKAALLGLSMKDISNVLQSSLSQGYLNYFSYAGRSYQVIPQLERKERINVNQILNNYVKTNKGDSVSLSTIATLKTVAVPQSINHFQQLNSAIISGVTRPGVAIGQAIEAVNKLGKEVLPQGYLMDFAGQSRQFIQESGSLQYTFLFSIIIIFLSLAALFNSFRDPLIILISVPMSICGAMIFIALGVGGATLNIYTEVGLVTLIGLISKHGILIVQFANDLRAEGLKKREALEQAASIRLRPILVTTAAMVLGVLPLLTASGAGSASRYGIGLVIFTGISIGTFFTLFIVPAMYMLLSKETEEGVA